MAQKLFNTFHIDVIGWLTERGVSVIMKRVQELPSAS